RWPDMNTVNSISAWFMQPPSPWPSSRSAYAILVWLKAHALPSLHRRAASTQTLLVLSSPCSATCVVGLGRVHRSKEASVLRCALPYWLSVGIFHNWIRYEAPRVHQYRWTGGRYGSLVRLTA